VKAKNYVKILDYTTNESIILSLALFMVEVLKITTHMISFS